MAMPGDGARQITRILRLLHKLNTAGNWTLARLAEHLGVTAKTVKRDIEALQEAGIPIQRHKDGRNVYWRAVDASHAAMKALQVSHFVSLRLAIGQVEHLALKGSSVYSMLEDLAARVERALGKRARERLMAIDAAFHSYDKHIYARDAPDVFWPLVDAISEGKLCVVTYRAIHASEPKRFEILPLKVFAHNGAAYLMAWQPYHDAYITLNLHRLHGIEPQDRTARPPADFDPDQIERAAFGVFHGGPRTTFRLHFAPRVAPYIRERCWHPSQTTRERRDGGVALTFTCDDSEEVRSWIRSWGDAVEVKAPARLRRELAALGRTLADRYGDA